MTTIRIKITGKNIERFIKRMYSSKIEMFEIEYENRTTVYTKIKKSDLEKVMEIKTIYEIEIDKIYGVDLLKKNIKKNKWIITFLIVGIVIIEVLSQLIFSVEVIHSNKNIRNMLLGELKQYGIEPYKFKKSYQEIQDIKNKILKNHTNDIEWLEIENKGTKYIVRVEERIITSEKPSTNPRNVVASKSAVLLEVTAKRGNIVKNKNDYVKKGDIVISGELKIYDEVKNIVSSEGQIYGEVWYKVKVEYPLSYYEEKEIGKEKRILSIKWLQKEIKLFNKKKTKVIKENTILSSNILPLSINWNKEKEIQIIDKKYSLKEAKEQAIKLAESKIEGKLKEKEKILKTIVLNEEKLESSILLELFIAVKENITAYSDIVVEENIENNT